MLAASFSGLGKFGLEVCFVHLSPYPDYRHKTECFLIGPSSLLCQGGNGLVDFSTPRPLGSGPADLSRVYSQPGALATAHRCY